MQSHIKFSKYIIGVNKLTNQLSFQEAHRNILESHFTRTTADTLGTNQDICQIFLQLAFEGHCKMAQKISQPCESFSTSIGNSVDAHQQNA